MTRPPSFALALAFVLAVLGMTAGGACRSGEERATDPVPERVDARKTAPDARALRRAYDGAPPVIPHAPFGARCTECHDAAGMAVANVGFAPPSPHAETPGLSAISRCEQCHLHATTDDTFRGSTFRGLAQDLRHGARAGDGAPPVMPHSAQLRDNCQACHTGPAAREAIRTSHPERPRCRQCHLEQTTTALFQPPARP